MAINLQDLFGFKASSRPRAAAPRATTSSTLSRGFAEDRATAAAGRSAAISKFEEAMALLDPGAGAETGRKALAAGESALVGRGLSSSSLPGALSAGITADIEGDRKTQLSALLTQFAQLLANPGGPTTVTPGAVVSASSAVPQAGRVSTSRPQRENPFMRNLASGGGTAASAPVSGSIFDVDLFGNSPTSAARRTQRSGPGSPRPVASGGPRRSFDFGSDIQTFPDFVNDPLDLTGLNFG